MSDHRFPPPVTPKQPVQPPPFRLDPWTSDLARIADAVESIARDFRSIAHGDTTVRTRETRPL